MSAQQQSAVKLSCRRIVLTGFMGSGKSTVGPLVAALLGWRFIDADNVIEAEAGMRIAEIFTQRGEAHFRELERSTIACLVSEDALVLALGGGAIETEAVRTLLAGAESTLLVHLEVQLATTLRRCGGTEGSRPVLADQANLARRYERRMPLYRIAHISIPVDELTPDQVAAAILKAARSESTGIRHGCPPLVIIKGAAQAIFLCWRRTNSLPMTPVSQAANPVNLEASGVHEHGHTHLHAPQPGATATLIHDLRELFKVKVVGLVLVTGWGGFYLGSMLSGISSVQRGLIDTLLGIGLVSAGSGALNEALERKTDARMTRTADRPLASGRFPLPIGIVAGLGALALGAYWLLLHTNLITVALALLTSFTYVAIYTPLKRITALATFIGAFPGAMGPLLGWTAARGRIEWQGVALFAILFVWQFPHFMAISWMYRDEYAKAGIRMLPVVQPDGWSTVAEALFFAVAMIPVSLIPWRLGMAGTTYAVLAIALGLAYLAYTIRFAGILRTADETVSRMLARDLLKVSVLYLPLLFTTLMICAVVKQ